MPYDSNNDRLVKNGLFHKELRNINLLINFIAKDILFKLLIVIGLYLLLFILLYFDVKNDWNGLCINASIVDYFNTASQSAKKDNYSIFIIEMNALLLGVLAAFGILYKDNLFFFKINEPLFEQLEANLKIAYNKLPNLNPYDSNNYIDPIIKASENNKNFIHKTLNTIYISFNKRAYLVTIFLIFISTICIYLDLIPFIKVIELLILISIIVIWIIFAYFSWIKLRCSISIQKDNLEKWMITAIDNIQREMLLDTKEKYSDLSKMIE
jgi:hypothetical protein